LLRRAHSYAHGLKLGVTYYAVDYRNVISALPASTTALSSQAAYALYKPFFTAAAQPASCVNGSANGNPGTPEYATYNSVYLKYLNAPGSYPPTTANDCQLVGILDTSTRNLGRVRQSGLDFTMNYVRDLSFATLRLDGAFTKILKLERNLLPGAPLNSALDVIGEQISSRGRFVAGLTKGPVSSSLAMNYIGGYLNNQTPSVGGIKLPDQSVPAWTTFDPNLSYAPDVQDGILAGTRVTLNMLNLTDKSAPVVLTSTNPAAAADIAVHSVFGRITTIEVSKKF
jgi:iron complex outermembrane receptor protein